MYMNIYNNIYNFMNTLFYKQKSTQMFQHRFPEMNVHCIAACYSFISSFLSSVDAIPRITLLAITAAAGDAVNFFFIAICEIFLLHLYI